jgi:hypothetical protein
MEGSAQSCAIEQLPVAEASPTQSTTLANLATSITNNILATLPD